MPNWALNTAPLKLLSKNIFIKIVKIKSQYIQSKLVNIYIYIYIYIYNINNNTYNIHIYIHTYYFKTFQKKKIKIISKFKD